MAFVIAVSGKGGTGKTTLAALIVRHLTEARKQAVLAVDADPNSCLGPFLGVEIEHTVSDIRENAREDRLNLAPGMSKERQIEYLLQGCVVEGSRFDLLTMGRGEGPKCYCYVNHILRKYLDEVSGDYPYVVIDNEAGMEHLSRLTTNNVDELLLVSEPSVISARTLARIKDLADELPVLIRHRSVVLNRVADEAGAAAFETVLGENGMRVDVRIPEDHELYAGMCRGESVFRMPAALPALKRVGAFLDPLLDRTSKS